MSLFNRPAWAKVQTTNSDAEEAPNNIFSHSNRSYREIVAEQERKKRLKDEKKRSRLKQDEVRRISLQRAALEDNLTAGASPKRRRVSLPDNDDDEVPLPNAKRETADFVSEDGRHDVEGTVAQSEYPVRRSPRKNKHGLAEDLSAWQPTAMGEVIELEQSDREESSEAEKPLPVKAIEVVEEESDDEFAELARRARQQQQSNGLAKTTQMPNAAVQLPVPGAATDTVHDRTVTWPPDPVIQLFISSQIEGTNPMIVHRKLSQDIAQVRRVWCQRQGFSERKTQEVYFIHRMRRVYDVTTCRSLGLEVDSLGNVMLKGAEGKENVDKIHLEAVTDELFRQMKDERARDSKSASLMLSADAMPDDEEPQVPKEEEKIIRLILKSRDREDFKLKVKPTTLFSKIIAAYTRAQLGDNSLVRLEFDGEPLSPDEEVQSTEISDLDCIDVHVSAR